MKLLAQAPRLGLRAFHRTNRLAHLVGVLDRLLLCGLPGVCEYCSFLLERLRLLGFLIPQAQQRSVQLGKLLVRGLGTLAPSSLPCLTILGSLG